MKQYRSNFWLLFLLFLVSCSSLPTQRIPLSLEKPKSCQDFFNQLDEKVKESDVRDASSFSIPGFPHLRTNRFLSAFRKNLKDEKAREEWVRWMQKLDLNVRRKEISNLPDKMVLSLLPKETGQVDRERLFAQLEACSSELLNYDQAQKDFYATLAPLVKVPDEYSS